MTKSNGPKTPNPVTEDDPKQSEAFRKAVSDLEAAGELNDTDDPDNVLDDVLKKVRASKT